MSDIANQSKSGGNVFLSLPALMARHPLLAISVAVALAALIGWLYLGFMVIAMVPAMDMADLGPGMSFFNTFGPLADLPPEFRASLAALCLPNSATTFGMASVGPWGLADLALVYLMWVMMVLAMMLPSAAPMLTRYSEAQAGQAGGAVAVARLVAGYLTVWCVYSLGATALQWALHEAQLATVMMVPVTSTLAATTLIAAGIYQFTPAKRACLSRCQKPYPGLYAADCGMGASGAPRTDAYRAGIGQGLDCLGCCWALMAVMFAVGVMNILWIAILGLIMVLEKTVARRWISPAIGVALVLWGGALLLAAGIGPGVF